MAATTLNVRCGVVGGFHKDSEVAQPGPYSLGVGKTFRSPTIKSNGRRSMLLPMEKKGFGDWEKGEGVVYEKMDEWLKQSVVEIVKNLREAPLLVQVYSNGGETTTWRTEKGVEEECWEDAIGKWKRREMPMPQGVIFVEQLDEDDEDGLIRAWGVVVQGRGCEFGPLCYLLKTSRGGGGGGLGLCCTHFCLMRVKSFRESAISQLKNCWLD